MAKDLSELKWVEELLPKGHIRKPMFGGFGYYIEEKMVLALFESSGDYTYKNKTYDFELWNGCLFPTDFENQPAVLKLFPFLISHPILPKWLYLPITTENFDHHAEDILQQIRKRSPLFGTIPKSKNKKPKPVKLVIDTKIDTRRPRMFSDEPAETVLASAKKISDLKNLGPSTDAAMAKAGIKTAAQFIKMGWEKAFIKLVKVNPKNRHTLFAYALIGALKNVDAFHISESDKETAKVLAAKLKPVKKKK